MAIKLKNKTKGNEGLTFAIPLVPLCHFSMMGKIKQVEGRGLDMKKNLLDLLDEYSRKDRLQVYSTCQALIDLIVEARASDGAFVTSERILEARWGWSRRRVRNFLNMIVEDGIAQVEATQGSGTIIKILGIFEEEGLDTKEPAPKKKSNKREKVDYTVEFEEFWKIYPRKLNANKKRAFGKWNAQLKKGVDANSIIEATKRYAQLMIMKNTEEQYIKLPETFLGPNDDWKVYLQEQKPPEKPKQESFAEKQMKKQKEIEDMISQGLFEFKPLIDD